MRYFIELGYNGTKYVGWQIQPNGLAIQAVLQEALTKLLRQPTYIVGSGRTDAGVHAEQQFAHVEIAPRPADKPDPTSPKFIHALNAMLPGDIAIRRIFPVQHDHHARFSATSRYYQYRITRHKNAFLPMLSYYFRPEVDVPLMNEAASLLRQHTDFESFSKVRTQVSHFHCQLAFAYWEVLPDDRLTFHIKANRFLYGMVRAIVGTLLDIGQGRLSLDEFNEIITAKDRRKAGRAAPASGLFLTEVAYPTEVFLLSI